MQPSKEQIANAARAERATNEQLTAALEAAEAREAELRARVAELEGMVPKCSCTLNTVPSCAGFVFPHPYGVPDACGRIIRERGQFPAMFCGHSEACHRASPKEEV